MASDSNEWLIEMSSADALYPLQRPLLLWGAGVAAIGLAVFWSAPLIGGALGVLLWAVGALWRRDESPVLALCFAYQWLFVIAGYAHYQATGVYPGLDRLGHIERSVCLSLLGFCALVMGVRAAFHLSRHHGDRARYQHLTVSGRYDVPRLFWVVVILYTINWFVTLTPMHILFHAAQLITNVLAFRSVLFCMLLLAVLQQPKTYRYAIGAFLYVLMPHFASMMSLFKEVFFLLLMSLFREWRPWSTDRVARRRSGRLTWAIIGLALGLLTMAVVWEGSIKPLWRPAVMQGDIAGTPTQRVRAFFTTAQVGIGQLQLRAAYESLVSRIGASVGYFSRVLERVPGTIPHERGRLTQRALRHIVAPRIFFPDKENLGGDSWLVRRYAGLYVSGEERGTSVGLGYMAEFYIDFGLPGMFVPIFLYGLLIGLVYQTTRLMAPSSLLFESAVMVMFLKHFTSYEGELAKLLGGLIQTGFIFIVFLRVGGPWVHRYFLGYDFIKRGSQ